ncbi:hypothetical protein PCH70_15850 [Pseudomonas cichorii JBC1]|nr:hypothetical protein PCH70_15850 [Pseudomonas cichorii JBC1]
MCKTTRFGGFLAFWRTVFIQTGSKFIREKAANINPAHTP